MMLWAVHAVIALALLEIADVAAGGRALFRTRERPERVVGARLRLLEPDGLGREPPALPAVRGREYAAGVYRADFEGPFEYAGTLQRYVELSARHAGYPVSRVSRRGVLAVNAQLESGEAFGANVARVPDEPLGTAV